MDKLLDILGLARTGHHLCCISIHIQLPCTTIVDSTMHYKAKTRNTDTMDQLADQARIRWELEGAAADEGPVRNPANSTKYGELESQETGAPPFSTLTPPAPGVELWSGDTLNRAEVAVRVLVLGTESSSVAPGRGCETAVLLVRRLLVSRGG